MCVLDNEDHFSSSLRFLAFVQGTKVLSHHFSNDHAGKREGRAFVHFDVDRSSGQHAGAGFGLSQSMQGRISANRSLRIATSAIWELR